MAVKFYEAHTTNQGKETKENMGEQIKAAEEVLAQYTAFERE
jgi:hypothetical protein